MKRILSFAIAMLTMIQLVSVFSVHSAEVITPEIPETAEAFITFEGYQVRDTEYNGLRSKFTVQLENLPTIEKNGYEVIEYGTLMAATDMLSDNEDELIALKGEGGIYTTVSYGKIVPIKRGKAYVGKILNYDAVKLEYACTVTNFSLDNFDKNLSIRGYAVLADAAGNEYVVYSDYPSESYRSVNLAQICDSMLADGDIDESNISYIDVKDFRERKDEAGWGPVWKP